MIAGNQLIASHIWITKDHCQKISGRTEFDDLVQEGTLGFIRPCRNLTRIVTRRFSTLAYRAVEWAIRDYLDKLRQLTAP